jgi:imidazolonepropionase-like amidohydrolase
MISLPRVLRGGPAAVLALVVVLVLAVPPSGLSARRQSTGTTAIVGATLIDGNGGAPVGDVTVVISAGRITAVGPRASTRVPNGARVIDGVGKYLTPGFVDSNVHVSLYSGLEPMVRYEGRFTDLVVEHAQFHLKHGVTTIRDSYGMLGPLMEARDRIARGDVVGPRMLVAGNIVGWGGPFSFTFTGRRQEGLSVFQEQMNDSITRGFSGEDLTGLGPDSLRVMVGHYLDLGPDFIKFGGTSHFSDPVLIGFSQRAQEVMVEAGHMRGKAVETHSTNNEGTRLSLLAGVDLVQHPEALDEPITDEVVRLYKERGVIGAMLSNTITGAPWQAELKRREGAEAKAAADADSIRLMGRDLTGAERRAVLGGRDMRIRRDNAERLIRAGVHVTIGTDNYLGTAPEFRRRPKPEEQNAGRGSILAIMGLVELGMTPLQAITAATRVGAMAARGLDDFGTLEVGKRADILMFAGDPTEDIRAIERPAMVMKDGQVVDTDALPTNPVWYKDRTIR